jgi:RNA polymerase-binding transcription factor DksA
MHITGTPSDVASGAASMADDFLTCQRSLLERARVVSEAQRVEGEAELATLTQPEGPDEVQFDEESGEGDSTGVARDRDRTVVELARAAIEDIDLALVKMDQGTYGVCDHCGERISRARLEALPAARLCLDCKGNPRGGGLSARIQRHRAPNARR